MLYIANLEVSEKNRWYFLHNFQVSNVSSFVLELYIYTMINPLWLGESLGSTIGAWQTQSRFLHAETRWPHWAHAPRVSIEFLNRIYGPTDLPIELG